MQSLLNVSPFVHILQPHRNVEKYNAKTIKKNSKKLLFNTESITFALKKAMPNFQIKANTRNNQDIHCLSF